MATYSDLFDIFSGTNPDANALLNKIAIAVIVAAETVRNESPATVNHANRLAWAKKANQEPQARAREMFSAILGQNQAATVSQIVNASDATIQTAVENVIDIFADGTV
jgi:primosomal replication protein N